MIINGVSSSIRNILEEQYRIRFGSLDGYTFSVFSTINFAPELNNIVSIFLYRVDVDNTNRHYERPRTETEPRNISLGLHLHYILTVWSTNAIGQQQMLSRCMEILDDIAILSGSYLDPASTWREDDAIKLSLESMTTEDMLRLWDSFEPAYHLSVPYMVRTIRLSQKTIQESPHVTTRTNVYVPRTQ